MAPFDNEMVDKNQNFVHLKPMKEIDLLAVNIKMMADYNLRKCHGID